MMSINVRIYAIVWLSNSVPQQAITNVTKGLVFNFWNQWDKYNKK